MGSDWPIAGLSAHKIGTGICHLVDFPGFSRHPASLPCSRPRTAAMTRRRHDCAAASHCRTTRCTRCAWTGGLSIAKLRTATATAPRGNKKDHPLVCEENCNYGFRQNMYGMRWIGLAIALVISTVLGIQIYILISNREGLRARRTPPVCAPRLVPRPHDGPARPAIRDTSPPDSAGGPSYRPWRRK